MIRRSPALLAACLFAAIPAAAQTPAPSAQSIQKSEREKELKLLRRDLQTSHAHEAKLKAEIDKIKNDRDKLNKALVDSAARSRAIEAKMAAAEAKLDPLNVREAEIRKSLHERRGVLTEVLATMQRIGSSPPPALLLQSEDALKSVRAAILLGAIVPELRGQADMLASDLAELAQVRRDIAAERASLEQSEAALEEERSRISALIEERQRQFLASQKAFEAERTRAAALAKQADSVQDLVTKLEREITEAAQREAMAKLAAAMPFAETKGKLPKPVAGKVVRGFGAVTEAGGTGKGILIATRPGAEVNAPCAGTVVFAGNFRNYGQLLIINAGGGYHILLAGMESITVDLGQDIVAGEPVAVMGNGTAVSAVSALGFSEPILYVEFRKNGNSIDPAPWWAATENEKARG
ncbi:MAG TPA: peptidoglycan DD-metalloendopeptidase family protein [Xanthobacteraceae bacterium]|nr:peptidoglycan DD-metalloendopeptidase family protein [Xanthobacteraceae bacterium]